MIDPKFPNSRRRFMDRTSFLATRISLSPDSRHGDLNIQEDSTARLIRNFLDCVKTRETPWCPLEEGHRSTSFAHLANIAVRTGKRLEWDADKELITNDKKANELLHYHYENGWKLT